jgi:membrane protease subunit HflK
MSLTVQPPVTGEPEAPLAPPEPRLSAPEWQHYVTLRNAAALLLGLWLLSGFYIVSADEQAVVTRFGRIVEERVLPGPHFTWPWPAASVFKLKVRQMQRSVIGGEPADAILGRVEPLRSQFLTGDQNIINVRTIAQYSIATPADYLFRFQDVATAVSSAVEAELGRQIAARTVDEVLTTEKVAIQERVRQRAQALIETYGLGVVLSTVSIEQVAAPPEAAEAFRDVASARADAARIVNEAEGYANGIIPRARGEAQQLLASSEAYKERKTNEALGDASRFTQLAREYAKNPEVTRSRLYLEAMEQILPRLKKTVVDEDGNIDFTIIRRNTPAATPGVPANPPSVLPTRPRE